MNTTAPIPELSWNDRRTPSPQARTPFPTWAAGVIGAITLFAAGSAWLVVIAVSNGPELVARDYYDQEIQYQQRINQLKRTHPWSSEIAVDYDAAGGAVMVRVPSAHADTAHGQVMFYRPAQSGLDQVVPLKPDGAGRQSIPANDLEAGLWRVRLEWESEGRTYYADRVLVVPKVR